MAEVPRSYGDACGVARALDVVGERWALLVVRELTLGPRRFNQLRAALPGISPNVLSQRLRELESGGLVDREVLPPPADTVVYTLTPHGEALDAVLQALGRFGSTRPSVPDREVGPVSFLRSLRLFLAPGASDGVYAIGIDAEPFVMTVQDGEAQVRRGRDPLASAGLAGDVATLRRVLLHREPWREVEETGALVVTGDRRAVARLARSFRVQEPAG